MPYNIFSILNLNSFLDIVSLREIASYLFVTPVYLSRIRKNLAKNPANKTCFYPKVIFFA